ncbi:MAG: hypothetical protein MSG77_04825 [Prevotella sp.]|nr:hypothetical protein [Prevotella sp.]
MGKQDKPLRKLYTSLRSNNYDVPDNYESFERTLTESGQAGAQSRRALHESLKKGNYDVPDNYDSFYKSLFTPVNSTTSMAIGSEPAKPAPQKPVRPQQVQKPQGRPMTAAEKASMISNVRGIVRSTQAGMQRTTNMMTYANKKAGLHVEPVKLGQKSNVVETAKQYNPKTGKMQPRYLTEAGNEYDDKVQADMEQAAIDEQKRRELNPVQSQLEDAYSERDRLEEAASARLKELQEAYNNRPWYQRVLTEMGKAAHSDMDPAATATDPEHMGFEQDEQYMQLMSAIRKNHHTIQTLEDKKNGKMNSFWHSLGTAFTNGYTFADGLPEMRDATALLNAQKHINSINRKRQTGQALTKKEKAAEAVLRNTQTDNVVQDTYGSEYGAWGRAGSGMAQSIDFMKDFLLSPGAGNIAKGIAGKVAGVGGKYLAKKAGETAVKATAKAIARATLKATGVVAGAHAAGAVISNTTGIGRTAAKMAQLGAGTVGMDKNGNYKIENQQDLMNAFVEAEREQIGENGSEMFGEFIPGGKVLSAAGKKALSKIGLGKISNMLTSIGNKAWYKNYTNLLSKGGYSGIPGEALEEYEGMFFDALTGHADEAVQGFTDPKQQVDIWLGCATMGALLGAVPMGLHIQGYYRYKHGMNRADKVADFRFTTDKWQPLKEQIDQTDNGNISGFVVDNILNNKELEPQEKEAAMDYVRNLTKFRGFNIAQVNNADEAASETQAESIEPQNEERRQQDADRQQAYEMGREAADMVDTEGDRSNADAVVLHMREAYNEIERVFDDDAEMRLSQLENDPWEVLNDQSLTPEQQDAVAYFVNSKAAMDGLNDAANERSDNKRDEAVQQIEQRTNKQSGMIHPATLKVDDRQVYIVSGNVAMFPDGSGVDIHHSSESVVVYDAETGEKKFISPEQIYKVDEPMDPNIELQAADEAIKAEQQVVLGNDTEAGEEIPEQAEKVANHGVTSDVQNESEVNLPQSENIQQNGTESSDNSQEEIGKGSVLSTIPTDEQGQPIYEQTDPDTAWVAILEQAEGNEDIAKKVADDMVSEMNSALRRAEKAKSKGGSTVAEKIAAEKERVNAIEQAKANLLHWHKIASTPQRLQEAKEQEAKEAIEREVIELQNSETLNGVPDYTEDSPQDSRARGYRRVNGYKVDRQKPIKAVQGKEVSVKFDDKNIPTGRVAVIDVKELQSSHRNGQRNPLHFINEAQPKERKDDASVNAARKIASSIRPEEITSSVTAYTGAPTTNSRGEVIQGNNRSAALREMWDNHPEQAKKYKQYLIDHASEFGLDAEEVAKMERPALVNMLDVSDEEAITLGQFVASDTESGGVERIKPKNVVKKLGDKMKSFANILLRSSDETASFSSLIDENGIDSLKWLNAQGVITPTQYKSAFDSKDNLTAEAKNDLKGILYQSIFEGANSNLEEMFNTLPAKAQKAILATAYRDFDSPESERIINDIQESIVAYYALSHDAVFMAAKNHKDARMAVEAWKRQYAFDDATGESYLQSERFSTFALLLATMYKGDSQNLIQGTFNNIYNLIQGTQEATLFAEADTTPRTLAEAIKETLNIEYDGQQRGNVLAGDNAASQERERGRSGDATPRGRSEDTDGTNDHQGGTREYSGARGNDDKRTHIISEEGRRRADNGRTSAGEGDLAKTEENVEREENSPLTKEQAEGLIASMEENAIEDPQISLTPEAWIRTFGINNSIETPIGKVKMGENQYAKLQDKKRTSEFGMISLTLSDPDVIFVEPSEAKGREDTDRKFSYVFAKTFKHNGEKIKYYTSVTVSIDGMEISVSSHFVNPNKMLNKLVSFERAYTKETLFSNSSEKRLAEHQNDVPDLLPTQENNASSVGKDSKVSATTQEKEEKFKPSPKKADESLLDYAARVSEEYGHAKAMASARGDTETNPTEAQKKAGNYRKGHIKVDGFDITLENPKGSSRSGKDANGKEWHVTMKHDYGYIRGTKGTDGDHIDVYLSDNPTAGNVYVVDQIDQQTGVFDEHKVMYGFGSMEEAVQAYRDQYEDGWKVGKVTEISRDEFKKWVNSSTRKTKPFADYKSVNSLDTERTQSGKDYAHNPEEVMQDDDAETSRTRDDKAEVDTKEDADLQENLLEDEKNLLELKDFVSNTDGSKRATIDGNNFDAEALYIPLLIDGKPSNLGVVTVVSDNVLDDAMQIAVYDYSGEINEKGDIDWQKWGDLADAYNEQAVNADKTYERGDTATLGFRTVDAAIKFDEWLKSKENKTKKVVSEQKQQTTDTLKNDTEAKQLATDAVLTALNRAGIDVVEATDERAKAMIGEPTEETKRKDYTLSSDHQDNSAFNGVAPSSDIEIMQTPQSIVYGWTVGGKVYLTKEGFNPETPIHEYTHLWANAMMQHNKKGWDSIKDLLRNTPIWEQVTKDPNYVSIKDDEDAIASEVLSRISGKENAKKMEAEAQKAIDEATGVLDKAKAVTLLERMKRALNTFWSWIGKELFKIKKFNSIEEITDRVLYDLINKTDLQAGKQDNKSLVGVHNITEDKLYKALKQGGLANPSVAIIDVDTQVHNGYGEISLLMPSAKIDKRQGKNAGTFEGDAWTPTYPTIEKQMSDKGRSQMHKDISDVPKEMQSEVRNALNAWLDNGSDYNLRYLYLHQRGESTATILYQSKYSDEVHDAIIGIMKGASSIYSLSKDDLQQLKDLFIAIELDGKELAFNEKTEARKAKFKNALENLSANSMHYRLAEQNLKEIEEYGFSLADIKDFVDNVERNRKMNGKANTSSTLLAAREKVKEQGLEEDYKKWLRGLDERYDTNEVIFDGFTPSGKRRYIPNTLVNVSKIMKKQGREASTGLGVSFSSFAASVMNVNGTLQGIKKSKGKLTTDHKDLEAFEEKWKPVYFELATKLQPGAQSFDDYGFARLQEAVGKADPQKYLEKEYGVRLSDEDMQKLKDMVRAIKEERPAMYFETKFERPVGFQEFSKAIVPEDLSEDLKEALRSNGIELYTYKRGDEESRRIATNIAAYNSEDIRFQIEDVSNSKGDNNMRRVASENDDKLAVTTLPLSTEIPITNIEKSDVSLDESVQSISELPQKVETLDGVQLNISRTTRNKLKNELSKHKDNMDIVTAFSNLEDVVGNSILIEEHRDRIKVDGVRSAENPSDNNIDKSQRFYGAVNIGGKHYRVKTTAIVFKQGNNKMHSYEITKIELLPSSIPTASSQAIAPSNNSITLAKLLKGVEFSYEKGRKVLDEVAKNEKFYEKGESAFPKQAELDAALKEKKRPSTGDDTRYRDFEEVNERFNEELQRYANGEMDKNKRLYLGNPQGVMQMFLPNLPIVMRQRVLTKGSVKKHNVAISSLVDMPSNLSSPIFVFRRNDNTLGILTEAQDRDGKNICVAIELNRRIQNGGDVLEVNDIRSVHGRNLADIVFPIVQNGTLKWVDKEKGLAYISSASQYVQQEIDNQDLSSAAKIVKDFVNPVMKGENFSRDGAGTLSDDELSMSNDPIAKMLGKSTRTARQRKEFADRQRRNMVTRVMELAATLHLDNVKIVTDVSELSGKRARAKGFYNPQTDAITIVIPNHESVQDIEQTLLHEAVAHYGLRKLFGEHFDTFLKNVYEAADEGVRRRITDLALKKHHGNFHTATEEYLASLAENTDFERIPDTFWGKIKRLFLEMLHGIGFENWQGGELSDNELRYILWRSYENLKEPGRYRSILGTAKDVVKQSELKVGNYAENSDSDKSLAAEDLFRDGDMGLEETITNMKAEISAANKDDFNAKVEAMKAIGGNLQKLRSAMSRQRSYDISTAKAMTDLAQVLLDKGLLDNLSVYETKRVLSAVRNGVGKEDISGHVQKLMDIVVDNQLHSGANMLGKLFTMRGTRLNDRRIEVQGNLDPQGQILVKTARKYTSFPKEEIDNTLIPNLMNRMGSDDQTIADNAAIEYTGAQIARRYVEEITESKAEEKALRESIKTAKEDKDAGKLDTEAYKQYVNATEEAIRQNKIDRAEAYFSIAVEFGGMLGESAKRAKEWREAEQKRINDIHHNCNSDMEGRITDEHHKDNKVQKLMNNSAIRFLLAPLGTFDQMLRMFGKKNVNGEGYLWNRFMRSWVDATENEYTGYRDDLKELDAKVSEVYGKKTKWADLFTLERKMGKVPVEFWDGGERKLHELTQGNLLYIYMVDKMSDGRMKLRYMGITEQDVQHITEILDPKFKELADWLQEEYLVNKRNKYNEVHKRMFGAPMAAIDNYFPLKILKNALDKEEDVAEDDNAGIVLPGTTTNGIIKRTRNNKPLDVTGADAFNVIADHLQEMEHWAAFAELTRDINTMLSYKRFRNQVMNMSSAYGAGAVLWKNFRSVCKMAVGAYRPPIAELDKTAVNVAKGVTAAKVSFRVFTALKQFLSFPAYLPDASLAHLAKDVVNPVNAWKWSMKNLPIFEKRWQSRMAGDPRLMKSDMDWKAWRSRIVEIASMIGMSPNAFVDALTVAMGAHAMYQSRYAKYKRWGFDEVTADKRAKQDATILYNSTQQSSEGAFLSPMQVDRSWLSVLFTVFRNSSMAYTRQQYDAFRNEVKLFTPGYRQRAEEFMIKQLQREGLTEEQAKKAAHGELRKGPLHNLARIAVFGFLLQFAWNLGAYLPYLILGDDDDEKSKMTDDALTHALFGSLEGLTSGDVLSQAGNMALQGEGNWATVTKDMPLVSDLSDILKTFPKDNVEALNDCINLLTQSAVGVNPQSIIDAMVAIIDYCGDDAQTSRECALLMARILNCPQSQLDKIYFDELSASGVEASKMTPSQIAERFARYKRHRSAPLTGWMYSDAAIADKDGKRKETVYKKARENFKAAASKSNKEELEQWKAEYKETAAKLSAIKKLREQDEDEADEQMNELENTPEYDRYLIMKDYNSDMNDITKAWLNSKSPTEREQLTKAMFKVQQEMVIDLKTSK